MSQTSGSTSSLLSQRIPFIKFQGSPALNVPPKETSTISWEQEITFLKLSIYFQQNSREDPRINLSADQLHRQSGDTAGEGQRERERSETENGESERAGVTTGVWLGPWALWTAAGLRYAYKCRYLNTKDKEREWGRTVRRVEKELVEGAASPDSIFKVARTSATRNHHNCLAFVIVEISQDLFTIINRDGLMNVKCE